MNLLDEIDIHNKEKKKLEKLYMKNKRKNVYIALEELNFNWDREQVEEFDQCWNDGYSIIELADYFKRTQEEIGLLIIDRSLKDKIKPRKGGLFGNGM